jgi:hypothetical protein
MSETRPIGESAERRRSRRHSAAELSVRASILAGPELEVINISREGVLVASDVRLTEGVGICLHVWSNGQHQLLGGRVARVDISSDGGRKYRAGIALDADFPPFDLSTGPPAIASDAVEPNQAGARVVQAELTNLRGALEERRRREEDHLRTVEMLKAALRSSERARKEVQQEQAADRAMWDEERRRLQAELELAVRHASERDEHLTASAEREERLVEERSQWLAEREALVERVRAAEAAAAASVLRSSAQEERERLLVRAIEEERTMLAGLLQEKERLFSDLEAARLEADAVRRAREQLEQACRDRERQAQELGARLEATEGWCADQQELIYRLREDMLRSCAMLESWQTSQSPGPPGGESQPEVPPEPARQTARPVTPIA